MVPLCVWSPRSSTASSSSNRLAELSTPTRVPRTIGTSRDTTTTLVCRWSNGIERRTPTNRRPSDSNTDYLTHKDNGNESDPQADHKMSDIQATHSEPLNYLARL